METFDENLFFREFSEFKISPRSLVASSSPRRERLERLVSLGSNTWDRKPATSMALFTRGLEVLAHPKPPPLSNESTWWLDQCRCCGTTPFLINHSSPFHPRYPHQDPNCIFNCCDFFFSSVIDRQKADKEDKESIYPLRISILVSRSFFLYIQFEWWSTVSYANSIVKNSTLCIRMFSRHIFRRFFVNK